MNHEATTAELCNLFGASRETLSNLAKRSIIVRGTKRGTWLLQPSVSGYVKHLREEAAARGGEDAAAARARLGQAQADLATVKARKLAGELVEASEVEAFGAPSSRRSATASPTSPAGCKISVRGRLRFCSKSFARRSKN
jgi:phage terminase Nu1 subunit (DNA packaging protein)